MRYCIGVDVGGTTTTIAVGDEAHNVVYVSEQFPTRSKEGPRATIQAIVGAIVAGMTEIDTTAIVSRVGLSTPGPATLDGVLLATPNLKPELWDQFPIRAELEIELRKNYADVSVDYIGDGQAAALGEYAVRAGRVTWDRIQVTPKSESELTSLFMAVVGTGLGGGVVRDGNPARGHEGRAGHVGHVFLPAEAFRYEHDRQLVVGNSKSTVESAVSLTGLTHQLQYRLTLPEWKHHFLNTSDDSIREKAKQLRELAAEGDPLAIQLFQDQARALGIAVLSANYLGDFDLIVIGGGVCDLAVPVRDQYRKTAEDAYQEFALDGFRNLEGIEFSLCGDEAPVVGALAYAYRCLNNAKASA